MRTVSNGALVRHPEASFDLVLVDGQPIGRLYVDRGPEAIHVLDITIAAAWRGRGIGTVLLTRLQHEACATSGSLTLYVDKCNAARAWYQRLGFHAVTEHGMYLSMTWSAAAG